MSEFILNTIKEYTGLEFETCDHFTSKLSDDDKLSCVDLILKLPIWLSNEYDVLEKFAKKYNLISVTYSGYKRVRVTATEDLIKQTEI